MFDERASIDVGLSQTRMGIGLMAEPDQFPVRDPAVDHA